MICKAAFDPIMGMPTLMGKLFGPIPDRHSEEP
jgi:hypothetical protein